MYERWPEVGDEYEEVSGKKRKGRVVRTNPIKTTLDIGGKTLQVWVKHLNDSTKWKLTKEKK